MSKQKAGAAINLTADTSAVLSGLREAEDLLSKFPELALEFSQRFIDILDSCVDFGDFEDSPALWTGESPIAFKLSNGFNDLLATVRARAGGG